MIFYIILILIVLVLVYILYQYLNGYKFGEENIIIVTGSPGTNKSYTSISLAIKRYKKNLKDYYINLIIYKIFKFIPRVRENYKDLEKPELFTNIPVRIRVKKFFGLFKEKWSKILDYKHIILLSNIPKRSVLLMDEMSEYANQYSYDNVLVKVKFQEFVRFVRHYGKEWYIYANDQSIELITKIFRLRICVNLVLYNLRKFPFRFYKVKVFENIINAPPLLQQDNTSYIFGKYRKKKNKFYDTHCYSENYKPIYFDNKEWDDFKAGLVLSIPLVSYLQDYYKKADRLPKNWQDYLPK